MLKSFQEFSGIFSLPKIDVYAIDRQWQGIVMVEKFNNSKGPKFSDMPVTVDGADLNWSVSCRHSNLGLSCLP